MAQESREVYSVSAADTPSLVDELNFILSHLSDRLDSMESLRGDSTAAAIPVASSVTTLTASGDVTIAGVTTMTDLFADSALIGDLLSVPGTLPNDSGGAAELVFLGGDLIVSGRVSIGSGLELANGAVVGGTLDAVDIVAVTGKVYGDFEWFGDDGNRTSGFIR